MRLLILLLAGPADAAEDFSAAAALVGPSTAMLSVSLRSGDLSNASGFVVGGGTLLVTNHHAVEGAASVTCDFGDGTPVSALGLLASDPLGDLVVLALPADRPALLVGSLPAAGTPVMAVGNPHGLGLTFSDGILSAVRRLDGYAVIQHSAPISPGNSGGPLVTSDGRVVGVNSFFWSKDFSQNLNFAVGSDHLGPVLAEAVTALAAGQVKAYPSSAALPAYLTLEDIAGPSHPPDPPVFEVVPEETPHTDEAIAAFVRGHPALRDQETLTAYLMVAKEVTSAASPRTFEALTALLEEAWVRTVAQRQRLYGMDNLLVGMTMPGVEAVLGTALASLPAAECAAFAEDALCYVHATPAAAETKHDLRTLYYAVSGRLTGVVVVLSGQEMAEVTEAYTAQLGEPTRSTDAELSSVHWADVGLTLIASAADDTILVHHGGY